MSISRFRKPTSKDNSMHRAGVDIKPDEVRRQIVHAAVLLFVVGGVISAIVLAPRLFGIDSKTQGLFAGGLCLISAGVAGFVNVMSFRAGRWRTGAALVCGRCDYPVQESDGESVCPECGANLSLPGGAARGRIDAGGVGLVCWFVWTAVAILAMTGIWLIGQFFAS